MQIKLTPREKDIFNLILKGYKYVEIAKELNIATGTVDSRIRRIYIKFGLVGQKSPKKLLKEMFKQ